MDNAYIALAGFAGWMLVLLWTMATYRSFFVLFRGKKVSSFTPTGEDISPFSARLCRAHANCYENLPIFAALVAAAGLSGNIAILNPLAYPYLAARIAQSGVHLYSTRSRFVILRFVFMVVQVVILTYWAAQLLLALSA